MKWTVASLTAAVVACVAGCAQTEPGSVCDHIATLQHGSQATDRIKEYKRLCLGPMTQAKLNRPEEYRCWSKCIVGVATWPDSVRCDGCVGSNEEFQLFQLSKTRKRLEAEQQQRDKAKNASPSAQPPEGGSCGAEDAACGP